MWFTKKGVAPRNLGFSQTQVGKNGVFTTGGPQQGQETQFAKWLADYDTIVVARASATSANAEEARPGRALGHAARRPGLALPYPAASCRACPRTSTCCATAPSGGCSAPPRSRGSATGWSPSRSPSRCSGSAGRPPRSASCSPPARRRCWCACCSAASWRTGCRGGRSWSARTSRGWSTPGRARGARHRRHGARCGARLLSGLTGSATGFFNPASTGLLPGDRRAGAAPAGQRRAGDRDVGGRDRRPRARRRARRRRRRRLGARGRRGDVRRQRLLLRGVRVPARERARGDSCWATCARAGTTFRRPLGVDLRGWRVAGQRRLGRVERARAGRGRGRRSAAPRRGRDQRRARRRRAGWRRARARSARCRAARCSPPRSRCSVFTLPLAMLAAGAPAVPIALGALVFGVGMISATRSGSPRCSATSARGPLARERLRLVRLARLRARGLAIWGPIADGVGIGGALWLASRSSRSSRP